MEAFAHGLVDIRIDNDRLIQEKLLQHIVDTVVTMIMPISELLQRGYGSHRSSMHYDLFGFILRWIIDVDGRVCCYSSIWPNTLERMK